MFHDERNLRETYLKKKARCVFQYREKSLLLLDSAKSHLGNEVEQAFTDVKSSIQIIHGGMTPSFQFLDTHANKPFKDIMNEKWTDWIANGEAECTKKVNRKPVSY